MSFTISPFETSFLNQLEKLPPEEWQTDAYQLFLHNEWLPWFYPYQVVSGNLLVGFGMFMLFDEFAWLGWILVHNDFRRKGIGTAITEHLLDEASKRGANGFILTATEMGKPVYEKFGFTTQSNYLFFKFPEMFKPQVEKEYIRKATHNDIMQICQLDYIATGEKRANLIENRIDECLLFENNEIEGFYIPTLGNGFIVANNFKAGINLINLRCIYDHRTIVIPEQNSQVSDYLLQNNFSQGYLIPRMVLGKVPKWNPVMIFNRASGYCG